MGLLDRIEPDHLYRFKKYLWYMVHEGNDRIEDQAGEILQAIEGENRPDDFDLLDWVETLNETVKEEYREHLNRTSGKFRPGEVSEDERVPSYVVKDMKVAYEIAQKAAEKK